MIVGRAIGAVHLAAFDEDALGDVVAAAGIGKQLVEQVAVPLAIPQMMMRIDDLEARLQDLLLVLRPPRRLAITRSGRRTARDTRCCRSLGDRRARGKGRAAQHPGRPGQHCPAG
jgi:hypothetical protein